MFSEVNFEILYFSFLPKNKYSNFVAILSAYCITNGVKNIVTIDTERKYWFVSKESNPSFTPTFESIKENSPIWNNARPVSITARGGYFNTATANEAMSAFVKKQTLLKIE